MSSKPFFFRTSKRVGEYVLTFRRVSASYIDVAYFETDIDVIGTYDYGRDESLVNDRDDFLRIVSEYAAEADPEDILEALRAARVAW